MSILYKIYGDTMVDEQTNEPRVRGRQGSLELGQFWLGLKFSASSKDLHEFINNVEHLLLDFSHIDQALS